MKYINPSKRKHEPHPIEIIERKMRIRRATGKKSPYQISKICRKYGIPYTSGD